MKRDDVKHYTPELAYKESKASFNWREYVQTFIDEYVAAAVKNAQMQCDVCIKKPDNYDYDEAINACIKACRELGWKCSPSNKQSLGSIYVFLNWEK